MLARIITICTIINLNFTKVSIGLEVVSKDVLLSTSSSLLSPSVRGDDWIGISQNKNDKQPFKIMTIGTSEHDKFMKQYNKSGLLYIYPL